MRKSLTITWILILLLPGVSYVCYNIEKDYIIVVVEKNGEANSDHSTIIGRQPELTVFD
jgi:hypothetical protein